MKNKITRIKPIVPNQKVIQGSGPHIFNSIEIKFGIDTSWSNCLFRMESVVPMGRVWSSGRKTPSRNLLRQRRHKVSKHRIFFLFADGFPGSKFTKAFLTWMNFYDLSIYDFTWCRKLKVVTWKKLVPGNNSLPLLRNTMGSNRLSNKVNYFFIDADCTLKGKILCPT